jgi:hypothetical protein
MEDTTAELIRFYQERIAALEAALKAAEEERDISKEIANDMIKRSAYLYHQTQRQLFI